MTVGAGAEAQNILLKKIKHQKKKNIEDQRFSLCTVFDTAVQ